MRPTHVLLLAPLLALVGFGPQTAAAEELRWFTDVNKAWAAAKQEKRPLLIYFTSADCRWCAEMKAKTFGDPAVAEQVNKTLVAVSLRAEDEKALVEKLEIQSYPTTVIISFCPDTKVLELRGRMTGYVPPAAFRKQLAEATPPRDRVTR